MFKFVRSWVIGGTLLAVAAVGCRNAQTGCATCGQAPVVSTTTGSSYQQTVTGPTTAPTYGSTGATGSSMPMRMPSSTGVQMIDAPGVR